MINSADALHEHVEESLRAHLAFDDTRTGNMEDIQAFWRSLAVEPAMVDRIAFTDPVWRGGRLVLNSALGQSPMGIKEVVFVTTYVLRWVKFSRTRWAGVGKPARYYVRSLAFGLEGLIGACARDKDVSFQDLGGYGPRATHDVKLYMVVTCLATYPCESVLLDILEDDRVFRNGEALRGTLKEEVDYVMGIPEYTWRRLAEIAGEAVTPASLRAAACWAACTHVGYVHRELFAQMGESPLVLT